MRALAGTLTLVLLPAWGLPQERVDLHRLTERLEAVHARLARGAPPDELRDEILRLRAIYARRSERLASELAATERRLEELGLSAVAEERMARARAAFEASHRALLEGLDRLSAEPNLAEVEACLRALEPMADAERENVLSVQELPLRDLKLAPPPLVKSGAPTTAAFAAEAADLAQPIGPVPQAIRELADTLDGPVAAYEYVKNNTRFELYFGSMKGSEQTWREGSGNDADINRLLVQLLRAEGVPARFVRGVVRLSMDQAMNLVGVEFPGRVEQAMASAAVPYEPIFIGPAVGAVEKEHVWVEAYLPWANYRGVGLDDQEKRWVPLDASFKFHTVDEGHRVLEEMAFDAETYVRESLVAEPSLDPMAELRRRVSEFLENNVPGMTFEAALRKLVQTPEVYGLLPASLPYEVVSVNGVSFEFPAELEHQVRFLARKTNAEVILDTSFPLSRLIGRRLTLSYAPAGPEDVEVSEGFGSIYVTPPFLIDVRPVIRSAGLIVATGQAIGMGLPFDLKVELVSPAGVVDVSNRMIAGAYAALALSGRTPGWEEQNEAEAGELLNQRALNYLERWNDVDAELAGLTRVVTFRPVASHVMVRNRIDVGYGVGETLVPLTFTWTGISVDADLRPTAPVAADANAGAVREFFFLSGLVGSELEGRILEDDLNLAAISTVELLRLAPTQAVEVREIDSGNVDIELPLLATEQDLKDRIAAHVQLGRVVQAPAADVRQNAWLGAGFVAWDLASGESAYMLSGAIAGGENTEDPDILPPDLREKLKKPTEKPSERSNIVAAIEKVDFTDFQEAIVGREIADPLQVRVTDFQGNPVADDTPVTFRVIHGGGLATEIQVLVAFPGLEIAVPTNPPQALTDRARQLVPGQTTRGDDLRQHAPFLGGHGRAAKGGSLGCGVECSVSCLGHCFPPSLRLHSQPAFVQSLFPSLSAREKNDTPGVQLTESPPRSHALLPQGHRGLHVSAPRGGSPDL